MRNDLCVSVTPLKPTITSSVSSTDQQEDGKKINLTCQYSGTRNLPNASYLWFSVDDNGRTNFTTIGEVYEPVISYMDPTVFECRVINPNGNTNTSSDQYSVTGIALSRLFCLYTYTHTDTRNYIGLELTNIKYQVGPVSATVQYYRKM